MACSSCQEDGSTRAPDPWSRRRPQARRTVPPGALRPGAPIVCRSTVTQTRPSATTMPCGLPPTSIVFDALAGRGVDARDGAVAAVRDPDGAGADGDSGQEPARPGSSWSRPGCSGRCGRRRRRSVSATQTPPARARSPLGPWPTVIGVSSPVGSTRVTVLASLSVTQMASAADGDGCRARVRIDVLHDAAACRVEPREDARGRGHPDGLPERRHRARAARHDVADLDRFARRCRTADRYA